GLACFPPAWHTLPDGSVAGVAVGAITPSYPGGNTTGPPTAGPPTGTTPSRFCATGVRGGGCAAGSVCLPTITNMPQRCVMAGPPATCPAGPTRTGVYTTSARQYA